jgi:hypothetical protein
MSVCLLSGSSQRGELLIDPAEVTAAPRENSLASAWQRVGLMAQSLHAMRGAL